MKDIVNKLFVVLVIVVCATSISCNSCKKEVEPEVMISAETLILTTSKEVVVEKEKESNIKRIEIGPSGRREELPTEEELKSAFKPVSVANLPPNTYEETDLSARLREKMMDAYAGQEDSIPDVKIYLSEMKYNEFVDYYRGLGYKVNTMAVPAMQVIEPALEQRPEMAEKINLADYEEIVIHQVMIDDAGISAADKYIDPDTFQVINKTFVTKMNK